MKPTELNREEYTINENISLSVYSTDKFKTPVLKLGIAFASDTNKKNTALFALMVNVLRSGTEKYPEEADISKKLIDLYNSSCTINGYDSGDNRILELTSKMLSDRFTSGENLFEEICDMMYQMLFCPALDGRGYFRRAYVDREKNVILDIIKSRKNNSRKYATTRCIELMCADEPYGMTVDPDILRSISARELTLYYRVFIKNIRIKFSYVGDKNGEDVAKTIKKVFGDLKLGTPRDILPLTAKAAREDLLAAEEELNIKQGVLVIGMRTGILQGAPLSYAMCVFNNVYGGTFSSRLFKLIREKLSLCYYCESDYVNTKGLMFVSCGIDVKNREITEKTVLSELQKLKTDPISKEELEVAKMLALRDCYDVLDHPDSIASFHFAGEIYQNNRTINEYIEKVNEVTAEDVMAIAEKVAPDTVFFLKGTAAEEETGE